MNNSGKLIASAAVAGAAIVGYFIGRESCKTYYAEWADKEIREVRTFYLTRDKVRSVNEKSNFSIDASMFDRDEDDVTEEVENPKSLYRVSIERYTDLNWQEYESICMFYWPENNLLTDENDEPVTPSANHGENGEYFLGYDLHEIYLEEAEFGRSSAYFVDEENLCAYEVNFCEGDYFPEVPTEAIGIDEYEE